MIWMALSGLSFVGIYISVKMVGPRLPAAEAAFLRFALGLVFILPTLPLLMKEGLTRPAFKLFTLRGIVHTFAVTTWFYAMTHLTVAEVSAMGYLTPVFVTIAAVFLLGEEIAIRRIIAIGVAIIGVLVILRPGFRAIETGHLAMLFTTVGFGLSYLSVKRLTQMASAAMIVAMLSVTVTIGLLPLAAMVWVPPTWVELAWLLGAAASATGGHYCMTRAFQNAPLTVVQPVSFLQLVWSVIVGLILFNEALDFYVIMGGTVIIAAVVYITYREAQVRG